ncbi:hypothetical protein FOQG_15979 [Fusarium oxysporum f. sp. raphani 54005]|uniref:Uncharacterized protein n=2 Tax=Fusarium oxysporum TaxID=5507 RepID=X0C9Q4_FUSOX|nr:hypothetical protein FOQG_15979 [Fusarium oxysporum f. sp. raphani 54005]RYC80721.1 hypothetical protein BFJ63_vAg16396 [Fusarium oxysporum f. sp. narcissi]
MFLSQPGDTPSEARGHLTEPDDTPTNNADDLSWCQLNFIAQSFSIFISTEEQPSDLGCFMRDLEDRGPQGFLDYIRGRLHKHTNTSSRQDSGDNYEENLTEELKWFKDILTWKNNRTSPVAFTDDKSCDVNDTTLFHRFEVMRQPDVDWRGIPPGDIEIALVLILSYLLGERGEYPELSSGNAIRRALLTTLDKCQNEGRILEETNPSTHRIPPFNVPHAARIGPGLTHLLPPPPPPLLPQPHMASTQNISKASVTFQHSWNIENSMCKSSGSFQFRLPSLPEESWFKVAMIFLLILHSFKLYN